VLGLYATLAKAEYCNKNMENSCLKHLTLKYDGIDLDGSVTKGRLL